MNFRPISFTTEILLEHDSVYFRVVVLLFCHNIVRSMFLQTDATNNAVIMLHIRNGLTYGVHRVHMLEWILTDSNASTYLSALRP